MVLLPFAVARGAPCRRVAMYLICFLMLLPIFIAFAQSPFKTSSGGQVTADIPEYAIQLLEEVLHREHPGFARWSCALGDVNGDGYDDFAVSSAADTTFVFFGGVPLNHEPAITLLGGGSALLSADFNNDGRLDIANAIKWSNTILDPDDHGQIRIFFQMDREPWFNGTPDIELRGDSGDSWAGWTMVSDGDHRQALQSLDYNGDGHLDLLFTKLNLVVMRMEIGLLLGGAGFSTRPPTTIRNTLNLSDPRPSWPNDVMIADVNGDGFDDILINGTGLESNPQRRIYWWDLYLGNAEGSAEAPSRVLRNDKGWSPEPHWSNVYDVNNDGIDDIVDMWPHREYGDVLVFLGARELPEVILPNDSIPNAWPAVNGLLFPRIISPVGDMNGDGMRDLMIGWTTIIVRNAVLYYLSAQTPDGLDDQPTGRFGTIDSEDHVAHGVYDVGDVNGDGCDDVIALGEGRSKDQRMDHVFQIYAGSRKMLTHLQSPSVPGSARLVVYPNPIRNGGTPILGLSGFAPGTALLEVYDLLGRCVVNKNIQVTSSYITVPLSIGGLLPGLYRITVHQQATRLHQNITLF